MKLVSLLLFLLLSMHLAFAKDMPPLFANHQLRHFTVNDGLASNAVYSFLQDSKGKMWFGTIDGLHSFDGYKIREWRDENITSLGSVVYAIIEDEKDRLWIGTGEGVAIFDLRHERFSEIKVNPLSKCSVNAPVYDLTPDHKGNIWISTGGQGVFRYELATEMLYQYPSSAKICGDIVKAVIEDSSGVVWAGTDSGLARYIPERDKFTRTGTTDDNTLQISSLFEDSRHNLWIGSRGNGLFRLNRQTDCLEQKIKPADSNSLLLVREIVEWREGELLLASDQGLTCYDIDNDSHYTIRENGKKDNLNDNYLQSLFVDNEGALWIGTYFGGINYVAPEANIFRHYCKENSGLAAKIVSVFADADDGNIWLGSDDAGVFKWDTEHDLFLPLKGRNLGNGSAYKNIHALQQADDKLFIGMYLGGLDIFDLKTGTFKNYTAGTSPRSLYSSSIYALYRDKRGEIWIGTSKGLNKYCPSTDDFERIFEVHPADVSCIMEDNREYLWVCTLNKGIMRLNRKKGIWQEFSLHKGWKDSGPGLPTNTVVTASCDSLGNLWIGTDGGGLLRFDYDSDTFSRVSLPGSLRVINKVIPHDGQLWLATTKGLYCYDSATSALHSYFKDSGLQDNVFVPNSGISMPDGNIYFGGINGFNGFNPAAISHKESNPRVILTDFQLFNRPVDTASPESPLSESITYSPGITLGHTQRMISFRVVPVSYVDPKHNRYIYRLDGFEKEWTEGDPSVPLTYTNLTPGDYMFRVRTADGNGGWREEDSLSFPIKVLPPWWFSAYMLFFYFIIGAGCIVAAYMIAVKRQKGKLKKLAEQKDRELYQNKIDFFTHIVHEIRTPLTLIISPLQNLMQSNGSLSDCRNQLSVMERNGQRLLNLVNHLMDFQKIESDCMTLHIKDIDIRDLLLDLSRNFMLSATLKNLDFKILVPDVSCVTKVDGEAFSQIVNNLLSNALKFTNTRIIVSLSKTDGDRLRLSVSNDGPDIPLHEQEKIFTPFYQIADTCPSDRIGTGLGLLLVKRYANMMGSDVRVNSGDGKGAEFILEFRCSSPAEAISFVENDRPGADDICIGNNEDRIKKETSCFSGKERLMAVDDNPDMLVFLKEFLSTDYDVMTACDASDGMTKIPSFNPELIVSDVMMPGIDGVDFCKRIKNDICTSHIPVILLTAKVDKQDYLDGFEGGADLYVAKPFSIDLLKAQIRSILDNRIRLRERYLKNPDMSAQEIAENRIDKDFFAKICSIVEENIANQKFTVDMLSRELAISRTGLFAKLKSLIGITPNDYIRMIRLEKAKALLANSNMLIGEVCWQVGFSSRSHFSKGFTERFGITPSDYRKAHKSTADKN